MDDYRIVVDRRRRLFAKHTRTRIVVESLVFTSLLALIFVVLTMASY